MMIKFASLLIGCGISAICGGCAIQAAIAGNRRTLILNSIACVAAAAIVKGAI